MRAALAVVAVLSVVAGVRASLPELDGEPADSECPPGKVYMQCGTACPKSCGSRASGDPMRMCIAVSARESTGGSAARIFVGWSRGRARGSGRKGERALERAKARAARMARSGLASEQARLTWNAFSQMCKSGCFCPSDKPWVSKDGNSCHASFDECPGESAGSGVPKVGSDAFDLEPNIFPRGPGAF